MTTRSSSSKKRLRRSFKKKRSPTKNRSSSRRKSPTRTHRYRYRASLQPSILDERDKEKEEPNELRSLSANDPFTNPFRDDAEKQPPPSPVPVRQMSNRNLQKRKDPPSFFLHWADGLDLGDSVSKPFPQVPPNVVAKRALGHDFQMRGDFSNKVRRFINKVNRENAYDKNSILVPNKYVICTNLMDAVCYFQRAGVMLTLLPHSWDRIKKEPLRVQVDFLKNNASINMVIYAVQENDDGSDKLFSVNNNKQTTAYVYCYNKKYAVLFPTIKTQIFTLINSINYLNNLNYTPTRLDKSKFNTFTRLLDAACASLGREAPLSTEDLLDLHKKEKNAPMNDKNIIFETMLFEISKMLKANIYLYFLDGAPLRYTSFTSEKEAPTAHVCYRPLPPRDSWARLGIENPGGVEGYTALFPLL